MADPIRILTYNIYNHRGDDERDFAARFDALASVILDVAPDVVCLQEAPDTASVRRLTAALVQRQRRAMFAACTEMVRPDGWREHLAIIHPGTRSVAKTHSAATGERIAIAVTLAASGVTVVNTHLNPHSGEVRHAQAEGLLGLLPERGAVVLCGDLNATPGGGTLGVLGSVLTPLAPDPAGDPTFPTGLRGETEGAPPAILDHILGRGLVVESAGLAGAQRVGGVWPSDHVGVWAVLALE
jgi:endonuclease/exonuclease/phosphatase family metal-dependent hydrolase